MLGPGVAQHGEVAVRREMDFVAAVGSADLEATILLEWHALEGCTDHAVLPGWLGHDEGCEDDVSASLLEGNDGVGHHVSLTRTDPALMRGLGATLNGYREFVADQRMKLDGGSAERARREHLGAVDTRLQRRIEMEELRAAMR